MAGQKQFRTSRFVCRALSAAFMAIGWLGALTAYAETIVLKNGMRLEGTVGQMADLRIGKPGAFGGANANTNIKSVVLVDDGLRRTLVPAFQVTGVPDAAK